jgi:nitrate/nitrite transport system substrate-binding protein
MMSRRKVVRSAAAGAVAATGLVIDPALRAVAYAQGSDKPEKEEVRIGFIPLTDCASVVMASVLGFDKKYGVKIVPTKEASWASVRDKLVNGELDFAHVLYGLIYGVQTGVGGPRKDMAVLMNLNHNGQAITLSKKLSEKGGVDGPSLAKLMASEKREYTGAHTFPTGTHAMWLYYWLATYGVNPMKDLKVITVPPPQMVANMKVGNMDVFCVGEPWNEQLVNQNIGYTALTTGELWNRHPEKVLGMRQDWVDKNPKATQAMLMAVMEAQMWCEKAENKQEMAEIVSRRQWFNVPVADIIGRIRGEINYGHGRKVTDPKLAMKFWGQSGETSYPWKSLDAWFITENIRWGKFPANTDVKALVDRTTRSDLWSEAAKTLGVANAPTGDSRGVETFFDGVKFDPAKPMDYLNALKIKKVA